MLSRHACKLFMSQTCGHVIKYVETSAGLWLWGRVCQLTRTVDCVKNCLPEVHFKNPTSAFMVRQLELSFKYQTLV